MCVQHWPAPSQRAELSCSVWIPISVPPRPGCVTLSQFLNLSGPQLCHPYCGVYPSGEASCWGSPPGAQRKSSVEENFLFRKGPKRELSAVGLSLPGGAETGLSGLRLGRPQHVASGRSRPARRGFGWPSAATHIPEGDWPPDLTPSRLRLGAPG